MHTYFLKLPVINPIQPGGGGGGSLLTPLRPTPLVFYYSHFSFVRAKDLKFYDFSNNVKRNLVEYYLFPFKLQDYFVNI